MNNAPLQSGSLGLSLDQETGVGQIWADYTPWVVTIGVDRCF